MYLTLPVLRCDYDFIKQNMRNFISVYLLSGLACKGLSLKFNKIKNRVFIEAKTSLADNLVMLY